MMRKDFQHTMNIVYSNLKNIRHLYQNGFIGHALSTCGFYQCLLKNLHNNWHNDKEKRKLIEETMQWFQYIEVWTIEKHNLIPE